MRIVNIANDTNAVEFAMEAAKHFAENPKHFTFADMEPRNGHLLAIRWNPYTVLVLKIHEDEPIRLYSSHELIKREFPHLAPEW